MTLNFQNKIVFPAPDSTYSTDSGYGQVIYIPRHLVKTSFHDLEEIVEKGTSSSIRSKAAEIKEAAGSTAASIVEKSEDEDSSSGTEGIEVAGEEEKE